MSSDGFRTLRDSQGGSQGNDGGDGGSNRSFGNLTNRDPWNRPVKEPDSNDNRSRNNNSNNNDNKTDGNDGGSIDDQVDSIWSDIKTKKDDDNKGGGGNNNNNNNNNNNTTVVSPADQLKQHLKDQGLGEFVLSEAEKEALKEGNFDSLSGKVLGVVQSAYLKAMQNSATLMDSKISRAVEDAVNKTKGMMTGEKMLASLHSNLPFTKDGAIGPVAQTIMQRFLDRGASEADAIKGVKLWFNKANKLSDPEGQTNPNRNGNYRSSGGDNTNLNWLEILGPGKTE